MKKAIQYVFLFCMIQTFSIHAADQEWTFVERETKIQQFSLSQKGKLEYDKKELKGFEMDQSADRVAISPFSPDGRFAVAFAFGDEEACYLLDLSESTATSIVMEPSPLVWSSWSPEGNWLLLGSYTHDGMTLYSISPRPFQVRKIPIEIAGESEVEEFNTGSVIWSGPTVFEVETSTHCSHKAPGCDSRKQELVIRAVHVKIDAETLETLEISEIKSLDLPG